MNSYMRKIALQRRVFERVSSPGVWSIDIFSGLKTIIYFRQNELNSYKRKLSLQWRVFERVSSLGVLSIGILL